VFIAPRGLREEDDGRTRVRVAEEWHVAIRAQAKKVWMQTLATTVILTAAAMGFAILR
jgi:hypothetical protein